MQRSLRFIRSCLALIVAVMLVEMMVNEKQPECVANPVSLTKVVVKIKSSAPALPLPDVDTIEVINLHTESRALLAFSAMSALEGVPANAVICIQEKAGSRSIAVLIVYPPPDEEEKWPNLPKVIEIEGFTRIGFDSPAPEPTSSAVLAQATSRSKVHASTKLTD